MGGKPRPVLGCRGHVRPDPARLDALDRVLALAGCRPRSGLVRNPLKPYRNNIMPPSFLVRLNDMGVSYTISNRMLVRCAALGVADRIEERIPAMLELGYFPVERIRRFTPVDTIAWRRFQALCEEHSTSWDEVQTNQLGTTICAFGDDEMRAVDRAASAYGISRSRIVTMGVIHLIRTWESTDGQEGDKVE